MAKPIKIKIINSADDHHSAVIKLEKLIARDRKKDADRIDLLAYYIEQYEKRMSPVEAPQPIEVIRFQMVQKNISPQVLEEKVGFKLARVFNNPTGLENLTVRQTRKLGAALGLPLELIIR